MAKFHRKRMTEKDFSQVKAILSAGAKMSKIAEVMGFSYNVILKVNKSKDWAEYEAQKRAWAQKVRERYGNKGDKKVSFWPPFNKDRKLTNSLYVNAEVAKINEAVANLVALIK